MSQVKLALNADTTPLSISDTLVFKSCEVRAREAKEAGFGAVNVDRSEAGLTPEQASSILDRYGLEVASGFFHGAFYFPAEEERVLEEALRQAEFSAALGQECLFVSSLVSPPERHAVAGRVTSQAGPRLSDEQFRQVARVLERIAQLWKKFEIALCYHPHVATYVEAPHEIDRLMEWTDPELVRFGPDTGHILYGGGEPLEVIEKYFDRVSALHIKDAFRSVIEAARAERLDYRQACARGVWTEIGTGDVDFPRLFRLLREREWSGWVIVETDHTRLPTALESSSQSRQYLRETIGI